MLALLTLACLPDSTLMTGAVMSAAEDGSPVPDTTVTIRTGASGSEWDTTVSDSSGAFEVEVPTHSLFYFAAQADGFAHTVFTGVAGDEPVEVVDGELWMRTDDDLQTLKTEFGDCAAGAVEGGVIEGEIRLMVISSEEDADTLPLVTTAAILAYSESGVPYTACYLDDEGVASADAAITGETGRFAIFGVPAGVISVQIRYDYGGPEEQEDWYQVYMPDNGTVPMWPALVSMPGS